VLPAGAYNVIAVDSGGWWIYEVRAYGVIPSVD